MCANSRPLSSVVPATRCKRSSEVFGAGLRRRRQPGQMPAESARARHGAEQAMQMPGDGMKPRALREFALDIRDQRRRGLFRRREAARFAEEQRIDGKEPPRLLIGGAAHHDAVDMCRCASAASTSVRRRR